MQWDRYECMKKVLSRKHTQRTPCTFTVRVSKVQKTFLAGNRNECTVKIIPYETAKGLGRHKPIDVLNCGSVIGKIGLNF